MTQEEIKLECLKLASVIFSRDGIDNPQKIIDRAMCYMSYIKIDENPKLKNKDRVVTRQLGRPRKRQAH